MSSKKLVYLFMVSIVCGFMVAGTAHGQSSSTFNIEGTIENSDGTPAAGLAVKGERISLTGADPVETITGDDGSYKFLFIGLPIPLPGFAPEISVGEQIEITVSDGGTEVHSEVHTVTAAEIEAAFAGTTINIGLTDFSVDANPSELDADGTSISTITVTAGAGVTGELPTISADKGTVGPVTDEGNGVFTATYTAPSLALTIPDIARISATLASTGKSDSTVIALLPVPTTVTVDIDPKEFSADTSSTGTVTVTVDRLGPIIGESIAFTLNPSVGSGTVSAATDNGDGTYTATYTSGSTAGYVTITARATPAQASNSDRIVINAGPPANIALSTDNDTVSSFGSATITATVTDSNGNGVGGQSLTGATTSGGTLTEFAADPASFGDYTATYSVLEVAAEGTETVTASIGGISAELTFNLTPEPPIEVNVLTVGGTVFKEDGEVPADGVDVMIMLGSMTKTDTTDADGSFSEAFIDLSMPVARTGDTVTIVVKDANGAEVGGTEFRLTNDLLGGEPIDVKITTTIVIPPRSVNVLTVTGMVSKEDGTTSAGAGLDVTVMVGSETRADTTDADGSYSVAFIDLSMPVGTTGDPISVVVSDASRVRGRNKPDESTLKNLELGEGDAADIVRNVETDIKLTSPILAVSGTVYLKNGDTPVAARSDLRSGDLTVVVTNTTRNWSESVSVTNEGRYSVAHLNPNPAAAETGDVITVVVQNEAGQMVSNEPSHELTTDNIKQPQLEIDVHTSVPAEVRLLHIVGSVINIDDSPAEAGLPVTISLDMHGNIMETTVLTEAGGSYEHLFLNLETPVAATGDILTIDVLRESDQFRGYRRIELSSYQLAYQNQPLMVLPPIQLFPPTLRLGGLSINTSYADDYYGYLSLEAIKKNPELLQLIPSGILHVDLLQGLLSELPPVFTATFDPTADITKRFEIDPENFGNGITPRPAWHVLAGSSPPDPGRWLNGNQLNLYVVTGPIPIVQSVTFTLTGPQSATMEAMPVTADGYMHTFQLEEERSILFLPSWPSLNANMPIFEGVNLMIDGHDPIPMTSKLVGDEVVWEAPAELTANSTVYYYYQVELAQPYQLGDTTVSSWPMPDPRNLQVQNRGIVEALLAPDVPELKEIVTTTDLKLRSVFNVPGPDEFESLWVAAFDFPAGADGAYSLDTAVQYEGEFVRSIPSQMFTLDRTPPTADITAAIGESAGLYQRDDGSYVTAAHTDEGTLNLTTIPMAAPSESEAYLYQIIQLDDAGNPGDQVWNPIMVAGEMLPLTYMEPHQIQVPIVDVGNYGIRAVGVDSILNISSNTMPTLLDIVPPDPDVATVTLVHADYNGDGTTDGPFEMEQSADGATIFSDRSNVKFTFEMTTTTDHPLKSIAIDFQINGERRLETNCYADRR